MISSYVLGILYIQNLYFLIVCLEIYESPNVKTVLFNELDIRRSCWNHDEINLLRARMIMQDLIPSKVPRDLSYIVEYMRNAQEAAILHSPEGKVRRIMMLALSDVLGGYLQAVAIPMAKESYYAGNIDYATMSRYYDLHSEIKGRLKTDGGGWSRPVDMSKFSTMVTGLHLPMENSDLACRAMYVSSADECADGTTRLRIPYLDYDVKPGAVAMPLRARNLYSLKTAASSHIIVRFYILARQCLSQMPATETELFNVHFIKWLSTKVVPHLYEDEWYPGFGSVMRIIESVNGTDILAQSKLYFAAKDNTLENTLLKSKNCGVIGRMHSMMQFNPMWFAIILFLILALLLLCCCFCWSFLLFCKTGQTFLGRKSSSGIVNAVLSIYCGLKDGKGGSKDEQDKPSIDISYHKPSGDRTSRQNNYPEQRNSPRFSPEMRMSPERVASYSPSRDEETSTIPSTSDDESAASIY